MSGHWFRQRTAQHGTVKEVVVSGSGRGVDDAAGDVNVGVTEGLAASGFARLVDGFEEGLDVGGMVEREIVLDDPVEGSSDFDIAEGEGVVDEEFEEHFFFFFFVN